MQYYARWIGYTFLKLWIQTVSLKYVLIFKTSFKNISLNKQKTSKCHERRFKTQEDKTQINIEYIRQSLLQFNWLQKIYFLTHHRLGTLPDMSSIKRKCAIFSLRISKIISFFLAESCSFAEGWFFVLTFSTFFFQSFF